MKKREREGKDGEKREYREESEKRNKARKGGRKGGGGGWKGQKKKRGRNEGTDYIRHKQSHAYYTHLLDNASVNNFSTSSSSSSGMFSW